MDNQENHQIGLTRQDREWLIEVFRHSFLTFNSLSSDDREWIGKILKAAFESVDEQLNSINRSLIAALNLDLKRAPQLTADHYIGTPVDRITIGGINPTTPPISSIVLEARITELEEKVKRIDKFLSSF